MLPYTVITVIDHACSAMHGRKESWKTVFAGTHEEEDEISSLGVLQVVTCITGGRNSPGKNVLGMLGHIMGHSPHYGQTVMSPASPSRL